MKIGFVGLGKMGLPIAVSMALKGYDVMGYDIKSKLMNKNARSYQETGPDGKGNFNDWLRDSTIKFGTLAEVLEHGDIVFIAVQTPHQPEYEGIIRIPETRADFDYTYLKDAIIKINAEAKTLTVIVIMSTVLPGTIRRETLPLVTNECIRTVYSPSFIAMGTTMRDFLEPEFVLIGSDNIIAATYIKGFYNQIHDAPVKIMSIESAELAKVAYNTFIGMKIIFANTVMEICETMEHANCDEVIGALKSANKRLISTTYMNGGMGDGGGCHPRDNIAMSWLADELDLSYNIFDSLMECREKQTEWLAFLMKKACDETGLPAIILGVAFKADSNLIVGSPALLLESILKPFHEVFLMDDSVGEYMPESKVNSLSGVYLIGCKHERYSKFVFAKGSIVIDPHRYILPSNDYAVIHLGE